MFKKTVLSLFIASVFFSCKASVDLKGEVDVSSPKVKILYPQEQYPTIRNSFTLKGIVKDDGKIEEVNLSIRSSTRTWEEPVIVPCNIEGKGDVFQWKAVLNLPDKQGVYPLKDGKYDVTVVAKDKDGKEGNVIYSLVIDNTPPLLFIKQNSNTQKTAPQESSSDVEASFSYGPDLTLKGIATDDSEIASCNFFAYNDGAWESVAFPNIKEVFKNNLKDDCKDDSNPKNDSNKIFYVKLDGFFSTLGNEKGIYRKLYGNNAKAGVKTYPFALTLFDGAKEYESANSNGYPEIGNVSNDFYLYDELYSEINDIGEALFPKYSTQDIYDMFKGSFFVGNQGIVDKQKEMEGKRILDFLQKGEKTTNGKRFKFSLPDNLAFKPIEVTTNSDNDSGNNNSTSMEDKGKEELSQDDKKLLNSFSLNPLRSPTFEVSGLTPAKLELSTAVLKGKIDDHSSHVSPKGIVDLPSDAYKLNGQTLTVKISPYDENISLQDSTQMEFYYCDMLSFIDYYNKKGTIFDIYREAIDENKLKEEIKLEKAMNVVIKKEKTSYIAIFPLSPSLKNGSTYLLFAKGKDIQDNPLIINHSLIGDESSLSSYYAYAIKVVDAKNLSDIKITQIGTLGEDRDRDIEEPSYIKPKNDILVKFLLYSKKDSKLKLSYSLSKDNEKILSGSVDIKNLPLNEYKKEHEKEQFKGEFKIDGKKIVKSGNYTLSIELEDGAKIKEKSYSIIADDAPPKLQIDEIPTLSDLFPIIKGKIVDSAVGMSFNGLSIQYTYNGQKKKEIPLKDVKEIKDGILWRIGDFENQNEGEYCIFFNAEDKLGNAIKEHVIKVNIDKASAKLIELNDISEEGIKLKQQLKLKYFTDIHKVNIGGKIKESNGIKQLKIAIKNNFDTVGKTFYPQEPKLLSSSSDIYSFASSLDFKVEGEGTIVLDIVDDAERISIYEIPFMLDKTPPSFKNLKIGLKDFNDFSKKGTLLTCAKSLLLKLGAVDSGAGVDSLLIYKGNITKENLVKKVDLKLENNNAVFETYLDLSLGENAFSFILFDKMGHKTVWNCDITANNSSLTLEILPLIKAPSFSLIKEGNIAVKGNFEILTRIYNDLQKEAFDAELSVVKDGQPLDSFVTSRLISSANDTLTYEGNKIKGFKSNSTAKAPLRESSKGEEILNFSPRETGEDDGNYTFYFYSDSVLKQLNLIVDNRGPSLKILTPKSETLDGRIWINTTEANFSLEIKDEASAVKTVKGTCNGETILVNGINGKDLNVGFKLKEGENTISFVAEDELKNKSLVLEKTVMVDLIPPKLKLISLTNIPVVISPYKKTKIMIKAEDIGKITSGIKDVRVVKRHGQMYESLFRNEDDVFELEIENLYKDSVFYFTAIDNAGNESDFLKLPIKVDKASPSISIDEITPNIKIDDQFCTNGNVVILGKVKDNLGIAGVSALDDNGNRLKGFKKLDWNFEGKKEGIFKFSFDSTSYPDNEVLSIVLKVSDVAGNESEKKIPINIKQESDLPIVTILNFSSIKNETKESNLTNIVAMNSLFGNVEDDDGITNISVSFNGSTFLEVQKKEIQKDVYSWQADIPQSIQTGKVEVRFRIQDKDGKIFESGSINAVKAKGKDDKDFFIKNPLVVFYDNTSPQFNNLGIIYSNTAAFPLDDKAKENAKLKVSLKDNMIINTYNTKDISFRAFAKDETGLKSASLFIGKDRDISEIKKIEASIAKDVLNGFDMLDFNNVDISDLYEGSYIVKVEAIDNSGLASSYESIAIFDFTAPTVKVISPLSDLYERAVTIKGAMIDESTITGSPVSGIDEYSIQYKIGNSPFVHEHIVDGKVLSKMENTLASWKLVIPNVEEYASPLDSVQVSKHGAIKMTGGWILPLQIKVHDRAGNVCESQIYNIKFSVK